MEEGRCTHPQLDLCLKRIPSKYVMEVRDGSLLGGDKESKGYATANDDKGNDQDFSHAGS